VAAPFSTIDMKIKSGEEIPIEERKPEEITTLAGHRVAPEKVQVYNPAFDVTPYRYVSAIISEKGVAMAPYHDTFTEWADGKTLSPQQFSRQTTPSQI